MLAATTIPCDGVNGLRGKQHQQRMREICNVALKERLSKAKPNAPSDDTAACSPAKIALEQGCGDRCLKSEP
jgi:hypothetical protein